MWTLLQLWALLPELVDSSPILDSGLELPKLSSGWLKARVESLLPSLPEEGEGTRFLSQEFYYHKSIRDAFSHDFSNFDARVVSDKCVLLSISADFPLVAVYLPTLMHKFS